MRKILILFLILLFNILSVSAANMPENVVKFIKKDFPKAEVRFDGLITIDNTIYLPLFPAKIKNPEVLEIKKTAPEGKNLKSLPDIVVFNNDFVLLKVIDGKDGKRTVLYQETPFTEVRTGLLPQDMLVPRGLIIPANIKSIIGGLIIATEEEKGLKVSSELVVEKPVNTTVKDDLVSTVSQLKDKIFYIITCKSKNIHVVPSDKSNPEYALSMPSIPIDLKSYNNFLLVTSYDLFELNVISLADEAIIKTFEFNAQPEEIVIDKKNKKAYVTVPSESSIFVIDLPTMNMKQKIRVNGRCSKLLISQDCTKLIYVDKNTDDVWSVELDNDYSIREIGIFPNVSAIEYADNKIYIASRTRNRIAVIDYATLTEYGEIEVAAKPVKMLLYNNTIYILSANDSVLQVLNVYSDKITTTINLNTNSFATGIYRLDNTNLALITGAKTGKYSVLNLDKKQIIKTTPINVPISGIAVTNKVKKINK
ncbi:hypothetical protein IKE67_09980 [bacterium]|nr:hypothetical protein [bacterium]